MSRVALDEPLAAELWRRSSGGLAAYTNYPVFSRTWLLRRTAVLVIAFAAFSLVTGSALLAGGKDLATVFSITAHFIGGALGISTAGPALATLVRHHGFSERREPWFIVGALILGIVLAALADSWASDAMAERLQKPEQDDSSPLGTFGAVAMYSLFGGGLALRRYFSERRRAGELSVEREMAELRERNQALDTRLALLQAQIEPHFLFNTLASVRSLLGDEPAKAAGIIDALVDYLRATVPRLGDVQVEATLQQQVDICDSYLRLTRARTGRLSYTIEVDPGLAMLDFPPLILVTLVENAIKHGIEPKVGQGHVALEARHDGQALLITVRDDGAGLRPTTGSGVGLRNVREQLRLRYGERASLRLEGMASGGAVATIRIADTP